MEASCVIKRESARVAMAVLVEAEVPQWIELLHLTVAQALRSEALKSECGELWGKTSETKESPGS